MRRALDNLSRELAWWDRQVDNPFLSALGIVAVFLALPIIVPLALIGVLCMVGYLVLLGP